MQAYYINLADKFTESPIIEYSLLEPAVPTTPEKAKPVEIPIEGFFFKYSNTSYNLKAHKTALIASS